MIMRIFIFLAFVFFASGCSAEKTDVSTVVPVQITSNKQVETTFESFSKAVSEKNIDLFLSLANPNGIHLVRKFTSGTLGGRGPELSELTNPKKINAKLQFPIKDQTPYSIRIQFQELPIKSFTALSHQTLSAEVETLDFDTWGPFLKKALTGTPETVDRMPIMLSSANSKYYVYAEAQIIDDILVGGFAVFSMVDGKLKLVSLIELL
ncbi:MAG: hypothetical protein B0W54_14490 [Cellvibrio sp. 79]|nr:MAG: hypothetical protein B0W54_14490 [Cellvibrio sp. 79]